MKVTHLRHVAIVVPAFAQSSTFFTESWGLLPVEGNGPERYFRTARSEAFQLALLPGDRRAVARIGLALGTRDDVDQAARSLRARGVPILMEPAELTTPGGGYGLQIADPDGRRIELSADVAEAPPLPVQPALPAYLAHIVLNTPDLDRATGFFTDVLGFRVSDWSEHVMSFLRCNAEHHSIALNAAPHASYNHTSWQMASIDALFRGQGRLRAAGTPLAWGTGRHAPGKQVFNYFVEPSGYVVEYITDGETLVDEATWQPTVYGRTPEAMDLWNTAGPPSPDIRAAMTGEPDPGWRAPSFSAR